MSISSLNPALNAYLGNVTRPGTGPTQSTTDAGRARTEQAGRAGVAQAPQRPAAGIAAPAQPTLQAAAPQGTDPELWSVLTGEERAFFAKVGTLGPLTYGRVMQAQNAPPSIRGGRLDIKV